MKILVLLEDLAHARAYAGGAFQKYLSGKETTVLAADPAAVEFLRARGAAFKIEEDFDVPNSLYDGVSERAYQLAESWFEAPYWQAELMYKGIRLGELVEHEATYLFLWYLRAAVFLKEVLCRIQPDEVWTGTGAANVRRFYGGREKTCYGLLMQGLHAAKFQVKVLPHSAPAVFFAGFAGWIETHSGPRLKSVLGGNFFSALDLLKALSADLFSGAAEKTYRRRRRAAAGRGKMPVLISASYSHVKKVAAEFSAAQNKSLFYLRDAFSVKQARQFLKQDIEFCTLDTGAPSARRAAANCLSRLKAFWPQAQAQAGMDPAFEWAGFSFAALFVQKLDYFCRRLAPRLAGQIEAAEAFLQRSAIRGILVEEDVCEFNKTLIHTARRLNIPSLVVQHGAAGLRIGFCPLSATCFAAWGEVTRSRLIRWGTAPERVVVTGNPAMDSAEFLQKHTRAEKLKAWGLDPSKKLLVLAMFPYRDYSSTDFPEAEYFPQAYRKMLEVVSQVLAENERCQVLVKLHPRDRHEALCRSYFKNGRAVIRTHGLMREYAAAADCILTVMSSTVIDVLPFKNPVVLIDLTGNVSRTDGLLEAGVPAVNLDRVAICAAVLDALEKKTGLITDEQIEKQLYKLDGAAAKRISRLFDEMITGFAHQPKEKIDADFISRK